MGDLDVDIISLNARGLRDFTKPGKVFNYMKKKTLLTGIRDYPSAGKTQCSKG